jgi:hypothetical protein
MPPEKDLEPLRLVQDEATGANFLMYRTDAGVKTELRFENEEPCSLRRSWPRSLAPVCWPVLPSETPQPR